MPSVEEVFDDDTDFPLPEQQSHTAANYLRNTGSRGALLEEITDDDVDAMADAAGGDFDLDMDRVAEQGKGYGDSLGRPAYTAPTGPQRPPTSSSDLRPTNDRSQQQQGPMGGIMGDFMKMQQAEEARMKKLEKQLGAGMIMKDQQEFKEYVFTILFSS